ncbi:hypothetical protein EKO04_007662 [Ascochyta lentis]|uniref:Uncharacterized protein n=1 Tax=Ascochyta lentis TaxID=205686 RepID=A0A8H7J0J0_9PLEO|nr:hypothetical protein EKO04_007662 [Ascochyta lentis]
MDTSAHNTSLPHQSPLLEHNIDQNKSADCALAENSNENTITALDVIEFARLNEPTGSADLAAPLLSFLECCLTQYDIVIRITRNITSVDLLKLSSASKSTRASIKGRQDTWNNLNGMTICDGYGVDHRVQLHKQYWDPTLLDFDAIEDSCAARQGVDVESHPCTSCQRVVCNECRIHVMYRVLLKDEHGSPGSRYKASPFLDCRCWDVVADQHPITHDQGVLQDADDMHDSEIHKNIYMDLGDGFNFDIGEVLVVRTIGRIRLVCRACLQSSDNGLKVVPAFAGEKRPMGSFYCACTLGSRYLDRWLCISCYQAEVETEAENSVLEEGFVSYCCDDVTPCGFLGRDLRLAGGKVICRWCTGEILEKELRD